jgi:uncharacterized membrane protein YdbT with pleckstrin-like domain
LTCWCAGGMLALMGYIERNLLSGEKIICKTRLHWSVLIGAVVMSLVLAAAGAALLLGLVPGVSGPQYKDVQVDAGIALAFLAVCFFGYGLMKRNATEMSVTNRRLVIKTGMLSRRTIELLLGRVESIQVQESFWGRMFGFGTVIVHGTGGTPETFHRIARPLDFRRQMEQQVEVHDK